MHRKATVLVLALLIGRMACTHGEEKAATVSQICQYGITWTFDKPVRAGQFITGDWWVIGPVTVTRVDPTPGPIAEDKTKPQKVRGVLLIRPDSRMRNGSMIVAKVEEGQGYDSRLQNYRPELSVKFPVTLTSGTTLISSISNTDVHALQLCHKIMWRKEKRGRIVLKSAAVLTVLDKTPPVDAFRPPYAGTHKPIHTFSQLKTDRLLDLEPADKMPAWKDFERYLERPWLDHTPGWMHTLTGPNENQVNYGREFARITGMAALMLNTKAPPERKHKLLIGMVQLGIDLFGVIQAGRQYCADGGHYSGRKLPILFAGVLLDNEGMKVPNKHSNFAEDLQTYYGKGWAGQHALFQIVWHTGAQPPHEEIPPAQWTYAHKKGEGYRVVNSTGWPATALVVRLMGLVKEWNHDAFFDYVDRWMAKEDPYAEARKGQAKQYQQRHKWAGRTFDEFTNNMWAKYRAGAPAPTWAGNNRRWVWAQYSGSDLPTAEAGNDNGWIEIKGRKGRWVNNPKPDPKTAAEHAACMHAVSLKRVREREEKEERQEQKAQAQYGKAVDAQYENAKDSGVPEGYFVLVQAETLASEGGGKVKVTGKKKAAHDDAFLHWDNKGHWLEYGFDLAQDGYYQIVLKYCWGQGGSGGRSLKIDGEYPCEFARDMKLPSTGGWSSRRDNWAFYRLHWPGFVRQRPFLVQLKAGKHKMRLENLDGGGTNLDYIVIASPFMAVTREAVER